MNFLTKLHLLAAMKLFGNAEATLTVIVRGPEKNAEACRAGVHYPRFRSPLSWIGPPFLISLASKIT